MDKRTLAAGFQAGGPWVMDTSVWSALREGQCKIYGSDPLDLWICVAADNR